MNIRPFQGFSTRIAAGFEAHLGPSWRDVERLLGLLPSQVGGVTCHRPLVFGWFGGNTKGNTVFFLLSFFLGGVPAAGRCVTFQNKKTEGKLLPQSWWGNLRVHAPLPGSESVEWFVLLFLDPNKLPRQRKGFHLKNPPVSLLPIGAGARWFGLVFVVPFNKNQRFKSRGIPEFPPTTKNADAPKNPQKVPSGAPKPLAGSHLP